MKKHTTQEAYYQRLKNLSNIKDKSINESKNLTLGNLIDFKRSTDGIAYGIVKENHNYYIKKGSRKENLDVSDFSYIGGMANITDYQYKSLAEADKNRNFLLQTINESTNLRINKTDSKITLNEGAADTEIKNAEDKIDDLEIATDAAEVEPEVSDELPSETPPMDDIPSGDEETPSVDNLDVSTGEDDGEIGNDEETPNVDDLDIPTGEDGGEIGNDEETPNVDNTEDSGEETNLSIEEIEKSVGKITNLIRKTELTDSQIKSYVNSFLAAFKDKFPNVEIEDRKKMAEKITKVVPDEDIEDLGQSVEDTTNDEMFESSCNECGFTKYAKSRGYDSARSLEECGNEELGNLISGFANEFNDGENDGDFENVGLIIKVINPEILNTLKNDYGHEEYAEKLTPYVDTNDETTPEENIDKINEMFGVADPANIEVQPELDVTETEEEESEIETPEETEIEFASDDMLGVGTIKPESPSNTGIDISIDGQNKMVNIAVNEVIQKLKSTIDDILNEAKPPVELSKEKKSEEIKKDKDFVKTNKNIGKGTKEFDSKEKGKNAKEKNKEEKPVMSESEIKLRKYIRNRLEEKTGLRKSTINENKKSEKIKKLDEMIDKQFRLYENVKKKVK